MSYQINKNYEILEGEITGIDKNSDYNCLMMTLKVSYWTQGYGGSRTPGGYEEQINYLKEIFEVENEKDLIGKKFIALSSPVDVFCLYNQENRKFFSLQAKFYPEQYAEALAKIKEEQNNKYYAELDDFNLLMTGVVKAQKDPKAKELIFSQLVDSDSLIQKLQEKLPPTYKAKTNKI